MAPTEREKILGRVEEVSVTDLEDRYVYEWMYLDLPLGLSSSTAASVDDIKLHLRTIRSNVALLESHVGEELWDAAKIFCAHLCLSNESSIANIQRMRGKKVLELGAGVASLGMCVAALAGASTGMDGATETEVLCTDYDENVLDNLRFNLQHNAPNISMHCTSCTSLKWAKLDWKVLCADDDHIDIDEGTSHTSGSVDDPEEDQESDALDTMKYDGDAYMYKPDIVIGSALVYSAEGAMYCADTIHHFLIKRGAEEVSAPERSVV